MYFIILSGLCEIIGTLIIWFYRGCQKSVLYSALGLIALGFVIAFIYANVNNLNVIVLPK